jgi:hypothetical protein
MKTNISALLLGVLAAHIQLWSPTAGAEDRQSRDLSGFDAIAVSNGIDLHLRQGDEFRVEVAASKGDTDQIVTEIDGHTLRIRREPGPGRLFGWFDHYAADVTLPRLEALEVSGGSNVSADGAVSGDGLSVRASGGSDVALEVAVESLSLDLSGGSDASIGGTAGALRAATSGGSDLDAGRLAAREAELRSSGGSGVRVHVLERLVATASGGSDISYSGNPASVDVDAHASADVRRR